MRVLMLLLCTAAMAGCGTASSGHPASPAPPTASGTSGTPSEKPLRGCVPKCLAGLFRPGRLPAGVYDTRWFFGGRMSVTLGSGWASQEDSTGEFSAMLTARSQDSLRFWEDVYPLKNEQRVDGVPVTSAGLLGWLRRSPDFTVSAAAPGKIGTLDATVVDVRISRTAKGTEGPDCPVNVCRGFLGYPQWTGTWGIAGKQVQRFYLADVQYGGRPHLFVAVVYPDDPADLKSWERICRPIIASVRVPAESA